MLYLGEKEIFLKKSNGSGDGEGGSSSVDAVIDVTKLYTPKEYEIYFIVGDTPYKLDYSLQNPDKCFIRKDTNQATNYIILDGKLFKINDATKGMAGLAQVGTSDKWTDITGYSSGTSYSSGYARGIGICDGQLFGINDVTPTLINDSTNWVKVSGFAYAKQYTSSKGDYARALGICGTDVYYIGCTSSMKYSCSKSRTGNFRDIQGTYYSYASASVDRYGIAYDGTNLYSIHDTLMGKANCDDFIKIVGLSYYTSKQHYYSARAIDSAGNLYNVARTNGAGKITKFKTPWQDVSGYSDGTGYTVTYTAWGYAINDYTLYYYQGNDYYQASDMKGWTACSGHGTSTRRAFGICNNRVYSMVNRKTITDIGLKNPIKVIANNSSAAYPTFALCRA